MVKHLVEEPILLLFIVVGIGAGVGVIKVRGISIGPAAALFAGLVIGGLDERLSGAEGLGLLRELGLALFVYTVGIASGPSFFAAVRKGGASAIGLTVALVAALGGLAYGVSEIFGLTAADRAGVFAGSATNTPSLQAAVEAVTEGDPVVGYSLTYPFAVAAMLIVMTLVLGRRLPLPASIEVPRSEPAEPLTSMTVEVRTVDLPSLGALRDRYPGLGFSRISQDGTVSVARADHVPVVGDLVLVMGPAKVLNQFCGAVGVRSDRHLALDRTKLDFRRILVSNRRMAGERIGDINFADRFGVAVTRLRRGDVDLVTDDDTMLALGDRVRVVGPSDGIAKAAAELGDSERRLSEFDAMGFALGVAAGLALGLVAVPLPGGGELKLGAGGGPLVVGLLLGALTRIGPVTFQLAHGANLTLRQLGILVFLAAAGLGSGSTFFEAIGTRHGLSVVGAGVIVAFAFALVVPLAIEVFLRRDEVDTVGMMSGMETQPAALAYVLERTGGDERANMAYALVFPAAMIAKIVMVQFLV